MRTALAYIRRSKESDERTVSLEQQKCAIDAYCEKHGLRIEEVLVHNGVSGSNRLRLEMMKKLVMNRDIDVVVAYHLDRVCRDAAAQLDLLRWFSRNNTELHTCNQGPIRSEQSHDFISTGMMALIAEYDRKRAVERSLNICEHKRSANLRYSRFPPYGFTFDKHNDAIVPNPIETETLTIIEQMTNQGYKATAIMHYLNDGKQFNRVGHYWSAGAIVKIQKRIHQR